MSKHFTDTTTPTRRVVDVFTRVLHALMAISFGLAYASAEVDALRLVHVTLGYTFGAAFLLRVVWGGVGPRRVSLRALGGRLSGLGQTLELLRRLELAQLLQRVLPLSMVALLLCAPIVVGSGYVTYFHGLGAWGEDIHESLASAMVLLASGHVGAVVFLRWLRPEHPLRPMLTGRVPGQGPDLVKHNGAAAAIALLLLVLGFWVWQAEQYRVDPQFMAQPRWLHPVGGYAENEDD